MPNHLIFHPSRAPPLSIPQRPPPTSHQIPRPKGCKSLTRGCKSLDGGCNLLTRGCKSLNDSRRFTFILYLRKSKSPLMKWGEI